MSIKRIVPNIRTARMEKSREFYTDFLGLKVAMDMGWIVTLVSPENATAQLSLLLEESTSDHPSLMTLTIEVADVEAVHARAVLQSIPIVYPLTTEAWGVRRFHVRDPNGLVINVMSHQK